MPNVFLRQLPARDDICGKWLVGKNLKRNRKRASCVKVEQHNDQSYVEESTGTRLSDFTRDKFRYRNLFRNKRQLTDIDDGQER